MCTQTRLVPWFGGFVSSCIAHLVRVSRLSVCLQSEWDSFVEGVDEGLHAGATQSSGQTADSLSPQIPLTDGSSGK